MQTQGMTTRPTPQRPLESFGPDETVRLAREVLAHLRTAGKTLAVAESCTGGLIAAALTEVPGASKAFAGGAVTYVNELKCELLGVPECLIAQHGVVSAEVAAAMAAGAADRFGTDYGLASTGFAGPDGGTASDPVGTVYLGYHSPCGLWACRIHVDGDRATVREHAVRHALNWMRRKLKKYAVEDIRIGDLHCD